MANEVTVTPATLNESARKNRKELLIMPIIGLAATLKHMSIRTGIRYEEVVGQLAADLELHPFTGEMAYEDEPTIEGRTLKTFLGSMELLVLTQSLLSTIYGTAITKGDALKSVPINKAVLTLIMSQISKKLGIHIWDGVRNAAGNVTKDLFDGFDTITAAEITAAKVTVALGNRYDFAEAIDDTNAVDKLKAFYRAASDELQDNAKTKMFISRAIYNAYVDDYQASVGATPYNKQFEKTILEGSAGSCELVPLVGKKDSDYIHLTTKGNMLVGVNQMGEEEKIEVRRGDNAYKTQFVTTMFFGTQLETISKERLLVGKIFVPA